MNMLISSLFPHSLSLGVRDIEEKRGVSWYTWIDSNQIIHGLIHTAIHNCLYIEVLAVVVVVGDDAIMITNYQNCQIRRPL